MLRFSAQLDQLPFGPLLQVCCSFEFLYKQAVTSTDAFLGMMDKDASSACCEDLELRIDLPHAKSLSGNAHMHLHHILAADCCEQPLHAELACALQWAHSCTSSQ